MKGIHDFLFVIMKYFSLDPVRIFLFVTCVAVINGYPYISPPTLSLTMCLYGGLLPHKQHESLYSDLLGGNFGLNYVFVECLYCILLA